MSTGSGPVFVSITRTGNNPAAIKFASNVSYKRSSSVIGCAPMVMLPTVVVSAYLAGGRLGCVLTLNGRPQPTEAMKVAMEHAKKIGEILHRFLRLDPAASIRLMLRQRQWGVNLRLFKRLC